MRTTKDLILHQKNSLNTQKITENKKREIQMKMIRLPLLSLRLTQEK